MLQKLHNYHKSNKSQNFQNKLIIIFLLSIIIPIMILSSCLAYYLQNKIQKQNETYFSTTLYSISSNMSTYFSDLQRLTLTPYIYDDIINFYTAVDNDQYTNEGPVNYKVETYRKNYISCIQRLLITSREDVLAISFMPHNLNNQIILTTTKNKDLIETTDYVYRNEEWFIDSFISEEPFRYIISEPLPFMNDHSQVISSFHTVKNIYTKRNIGVIRIDASLNNIQNMFQNVELTPHSGFIVTDQKGAPIYHVGNLDKETIPYLTINENMIKTSSDTYTIYKKRIDGTPWSLTFLSSNKDNMQTILFIWMLASILSILTIMIGCLFFRRNSQRTTVILNSILKTMDSAAKGNLNVHVPKEIINDTNFFVADEFNMIGDNLNQMIEQLDLYIQRSYKYEIQRQEAEYRALQNQINPHFLYNTMNCFVSLNRLGMKQELENGILQLTHIFRYTCSNEKTTTVEKELDFCIQYCNVMKLRFEERITYYCECEESSRKIEIPRLLMQPFVENAIKHGMDPDGRSITIWINSYVQDNNLVLSVRNNGIPIDLSILRSSENVGITNVENRLKLFHPDSSLDIELMDEITSFTIRIPLTPLVSTSSDRDPIL